MRFFFSLIDMLMLCFYSSKFLSFFKEAKSQSMLSASVFFTPSAPVLSIFLNSVLGIQCYILQFLCKDITFSVMLKNFGFFNVKMAVQHGK